MAFDSLAREIDPALPEAGAARVLALAGLHGSLADPLLDTMNFLNEVTVRYPDAVSFAPGRPYEGLFDPERITDYLNAYTDHLRRSGLTEDQVRAVLFQYGRTKGQIHGLIAEALANDEDIRVPPESIVVTVGAQEGMFLTLRALFADPSDALLVSSPCYIGITGAARLLDIPVVPVPEGEAGPDPEAVRAIARRVKAEGRRPRMLYVVPDFANPSGASMPVAARRELLAVAASEDLLIMEDNPYGFFTREIEPRPTLKSLDRDGSVVYLGSFAKTCFPGARLGYTIADQRVLGDGGRESLLADELAKIKSMITVNTPSLSQAVIGGMLLMSGCRLREMNAPAIGFYRDNLLTVLSELERHFPATRRADLGLGWNRPEGGFFTVLTVPFVADETALERSAREYGVLWTPMDAFFVGGGGRHQLRISSSYLARARVEEGIERLAAFIDAESGRVHA
ncbi:PLP-dependent aminotransferase family protein [Actinomadura sp. DC4]|uniref:aminotransferase-like domain-containing protein n=1 Tax=Actinomadura sp. DC4 TaxID=3055069 RepID=UPI0025AF6751|nr:PLP-dependent aminotransferase family protein [Actinomadura sp. DC4]MDN3360146.1 PLP-dependent aminotransferase family protein [Actinomadura sp. DC4]